MSFLPPNRLSILTRIPNPLPPKPRLSLSALSHRTPAATQRHSSSTPRALAARALPPPTPFVPSVAVFLSLIGRDMKQFESKIASWEALFRLTGAQLQALGVEPARKRRYLLWCRERFRTGVWGVGGDCRFVSDDGIAFLRTVVVPDREAGGGKLKKIVVNVPPPNVEYKVPDDARPLAGAVVTDMDAIGGSWFDPVKQGNNQWSRLVRREGLWEHKQGVKVLGGERRRAEVLTKMRQAERKKAKLAG